MFSLYLKEQLASLCIYSIFKNALALHECAASMKCILHFWIKINLYIFLGDKNVKVL